jgi:cystathionine beta-lyase/cystathionine gamma-synthase
MCTNPLIRVPDVEALAAIAHDAGALLVVDNTVPTPALSQPLRWGADVVIYSATKNLSGHADVIGGLVVGKPSWIEGARAFAHTFGPTLGPFDAWLTLRGIRTLAVRMARHTANALALARFLERHAAVSRVRSAREPARCYRGAPAPCFPSSWPAGSPRWSRWCHGCNWSG